MDAMIKQLIALLDEKQYITVERIAVAVGVSEKTVRTRLKKLAGELSSHGATLEMKKHAGFRLVISDSELYKSWAAGPERTGEVLPNTPKDRINYLLSQLLNHHEYIKLEELSERLFVSYGTLTSGLKNVEKILEKYHLQIERRPGYGIRIQGSELDQRICLAHCLLVPDLSVNGTTKQRRETERLARILQNAIRMHGIQMAKTSFDSLIVHMYVANGRIRHGFTMQYTDQAREELINRELSVKALQTAEDISKEIEREEGIRYNEDEILYLAIHLSAKMVSDSWEKDENDLAISERSDYLVVLILEAVYEGYKIDFKDDLELCISLNQHIVPLDIRLRYRIPLKNPILNEIKKEYTFAYTIATTGCMALAEQYGCEIPEDEIGYIAILFALALEKRKIKARRKNIVMVCATGRGTLNLFLHRYKQAFGNYIDNIYTCTVYELDTFDFEAKKIDYVFTTVPLHTRLPVPVFDAPLFLSDTEKNVYRNIFESGDNRFLSDYFAPELFMPLLHGESKEEVLEMMCAHIGKHRQIPDDFCGLVKERERMGQTDFGNLIAIPHPCRIVSEKQFVAVAVLDKPTWWGHNDVQVVLLLSLSKEREEHIEEFYQMISNLLMGPELVSRLLQKPDFLTLLEIMQEAGRS